MMKKIIASSLLAFAATTAFAAEEASTPAADPTGSITVKVTGLKPKEAKDGTYIVSIHDSAGNWPLIAKAFAVKKIPVSELGDATELEVTFDNVKLGHAYAMQALHDENGNGELDFKFVVFPKEGFGLSNNYKPREEPKFDKAAMPFESAPMTTEIALEY